MCACSEHARILAFVMIENNVERSIEHRQRRAAAPLFQCAQTTNELWKLQRMVFVCAELLLSYDVDVVAVVVWVLKKAICAYVWMNVRAPGRLTTPVDRFMAGVIYEWHPDGLPHQWLFAETRTFHTHTHTSTHTRFGSKRREHCWWTPGINAATATAKYIR